MVYQPSKEYLFNRILWTAFLPAICTVIVLKSWDPSGISRNIFWLVGLPLAWFLFANTAWAWVQIYRCKLFLDQEGLGLSIGAEELKKIE